LIALNDIVTNATS